MSKVVPPDGFGKTGLSAGASTWVKNNVKDLEWIPEPGEEWIARDVDCGNIRLDHLRDIGVIKSDGSKRVTIAGTHKIVNVYETTEVGFRAVCDYLEDVEEHGFTPCPCGHTGVSNLGDGEYGCLNDGCEEKYPRDEVDV